VWPAFRDRLVARTEALTVGDPTVPGTDLGAVITARQFAKHADALPRARAEGLVLTGGSADDRVGWFVRPIVLQVADPKSWPMTEELFAPVTAAYVYEDAEWEATLQLVDDSTPYGLTGAVSAPTIGRSSRRTRRCVTRPAT
jgi:1-pyrroline-5-carboxylate dehydrogenase